MTFPTKKILPIKLEKYCESQGKGVHKYELHGVHLTKLLGSDESVSLIELFAEEVPEDAEVVVNYDDNIGGAANPYVGGNSCPTHKRVICLYTAKGLALIPRKDSAGYLKKKEKVLEVIKNRKNTRN